MRIEKHIIDKNFSEAANTYDLWAKHQNRIAKTLSSHIPILANINNILDLGCGTGNSIESLLSLYPDADVLGVDIAEGMIEYCREKWKDYKKINFHQCDIEDLELSQKYDLIISSCSLQWLTDIKSTFNKFLNCMNPGGYLALAIPVEGSLNELKHSYVQVFSSDIPGLYFQNENMLIDAINQNRVKNCHTFTEVVSEYYESLDVLRYFRKIGVTFSNQHNYKTKSISEIRMLMKQYQQDFMLNNRLPISYKILYLIVEV
jgi:malonyl-CoA O-methyltransferase